MTLEDKIKRMAESIYVANRKHSGNAADFLLSRGWTPVGNGLWRSPKNKQDEHLQRALKHERKWDTTAVITHVLPDWPNVEVTNDHSAKGISYLKSENPPEQGRPL